MKVSHIKIANVLGIAELEFSPGGWTEISGSNGAGKTSVLEAIRAALSGGSDATLLRQGEKRGEIVLVLDDGTEIKKRITPSGTTVAVEKAGAVMKKPASVIAQLADALSVNPVEFLRAPDKQRVSVLLEAMPIEVDRKRLGEIVGLPGPVLGGAEGLDLLEVCRKDVYDQRTGVNRVLKEKRAAIEQLRATLPDQQPEAPPSDAELQAKLREVDAAHEAEQSRIAMKLAKLQADSDERIRILQEQIEAERESMRAVKSAAANSVSEARADHQIARRAVEIDIEGIAEARRDGDRYAQTVETIKSMRTDADALERESDDCTAALESLEAYKGELLASLPIPGLEVRDGSIYRDGIAFDRLNEAQKVRIAIEIARLRAGALGLVCVDGLELLDPHAYEAFRKDAEEFNLQLIVSRVSEGPLRVESAA